MSSSTGLGPPWDDIRRVIESALDEDLPSGDLTGAAIGPKPARARLVPRQAGTLSGLVAAQLLLDRVANRLGSGSARARLSSADASPVEREEVLAVLEGPADTLLAGERALLNLVGHLSGVATATAAMVKAVAGTGAVVRDTRKTLPGLRSLEKYAVRCGGGSNHRMSLSDGVLVKDNHVAAMGSVKAALEAARRSAGPASRVPFLVEVEVDNLRELDEALAGGAELVLLDNMPRQDLVTAVARARAAGARTEASGGIQLGNIRAVAECGVDYIAVGALTHSAPALDIGLDWEI
ncbi:MAG TPA: carboxylating nicotinate-nucleotide diphosphorylase [Acidimicrobiales bacterium]|nr:carboxylating nicotinate-nucleotide diphosphorylase [Acidimicrobiales bacterium]